MIDATTRDFEKAEYALLRRANDQYRQIVFSSAFYATTGGTYEKAVDMATKDFMKKGIDCIEYKNGSRHNIKDYADMAIKTAGKRAYLTGEGEKRKEYGISTVIMNKRGNPCPLCRPFCGKVMVDDVWSGGSPDGISPVTGIKYPTMSSAVAAGLYHPRCRDAHSTYYEGISTMSANDEYTKEELATIAEDYKKEQELNRAIRQAESYARLAAFALDKDNKRMYEARAEEWKERIKKNSKDDIEGADSGSALDDAQEINDDVVQRLLNHGVAVNIENAGKYYDVAIENLNHLDKLMNEYKSTTVSYNVGKTAGVQTEMGSAYMLNGKTSILVDPKAYKIIKATDALNLGENQPYGLTYHEFAHSLSQSREKIDPDFWKEIRSIKKEYESQRNNSNWFDIQISQYASKNVDEFLAEAFTQAKLSAKPSPYSKKVLDTVDKYFKKEPLENIGKSSTIKVTKTISGHSGTPKKAEPNAIIDHVNDDGKVDARSFHDSVGVKKKDIHTTDHGNQKHHNYGEHGEHGHDYEWNDDGSLKNKTTRDLTDEERKENGDIL